MLYYSILTTSTFGKIIYQPLIYPFLPQVLNNNMIIFYYQVANSVLKQRFCVKHFFLNVFSASIIN